MQERQSVYIFNGLYLARHSWRLCESAYGTVRMVCSTPPPPGLVMTQIEPSLADYSVKHSKVRSTEKFGPYGPSGADPAFM